MKDKKNVNIGKFVKLDFEKSSGRIPVTLPYNLGAANPQLSLFDELENKRRERLLVSDKKYSIVRNGKRVVLTSMEKRVVYALAVYVNNFLKDDPDLMNLIKDDYVDKELTKKEFAIDIKLLAQVVLRRSYTEQQNKIRGILDDLSCKRQVIESITLDKKKKIIIDSPLIHLEEGFREEDLESPEEEKIEHNVINLSFGRIFFWNLHKRYAYFPVRLFEIWHKKGIGTDTVLFEVLLEILLANFWHCMLAYKTAKPELDKELKEKKQNVPKEEYMKLLLKRQNAALTYKESLSSILSKVDIQYNKHRRGKRLEKDLQKAVDVLKSEYVGIITNFREEVTSVDTYLYFKYNLDYAKFNDPFIGSLENNTAPEEISKENKDEDGITEN